MATGLTKITDVALRITLTQLKEQKRQYAPYVAAVQATLNEVFGTLGIIAYGVAGGRLTQTELTSYMEAAMGEVQNRLSVLGVTFNATATAASGGVDVTWTASKGANSDSSSHALRGNVEDFSDDYAASISLAVARFSRWAQSLTADAADRILKAAVAGYESFMLNGTPSARQQLAAIKHKLRTDAVDRNFYLSQLQSSANKYQNGYQGGVVKYRTIAKWVLDGILAATKATISVVRVL